MARSTDINQRIVLSGSEEVRRGLEQIAQAGERSGNQIRQTLLAATSGTSAFTTGAQQATKSSGAMRAALQNLSFQVNDVATSLASGGDLARVFAQQAGQIAQVFQQGGGVTAVLSAAGTAIRGLITPLTVAAAGFAAVGAGAALVISRAVGSEAAIRQFDVILKATGKSSQSSGKELDTLSEQFRDVGLSGNEAREALQKALREGVNPSEISKVVRAGAELNAVFGEGTLDKFISAAATGGPQLEEFARKLGIIPGVADETVKALKAAADEAKKAADAFTDAFRQRSEALADEQRQSALQLSELTRKRGTEEQEIELASKRRIEDINRQHVRRINDLIRQRNAENARRLAEFNQQITDAAQKALDRTSLLNQIFNRVFGSSANLLGPLGQALRDLNTAFNEFVNSLAKSGFFTAIVTGFGNMVTAITALIKGEFSFQAFGAAILLALPIFAALRLAALGVAAALGPIGIIAAVIALAAVFLDLNKAWAGVTAAADGFWTLLKALGAWARDTFVSTVKSYIVDPIQSVIGFFNDLIATAKEAANALAAVFGGRPQLDLTSPTAQAAFSGNFAAGGLVRGPGTGTSDSIRARISNGEFVVNALATKFNLPLLEAINSLRQPLVPRSRMPRGFAAGGLVTAGAGGGGTPVHLHLGGREFRLSGASDVVDDLRQEARTRSMLSGGRPQSWKRS